MKKNAQKIAGKIGSQRQTSGFPRCQLYSFREANAGDSLLAELLMGKYLYHLSFHRQIEIFKMIGITLVDSALWDWFQGSCDLLRALYYWLKEVVLATDYIMVDESTLPEIDSEKQKAVKAYL